MKSIADSLVLEELIRRLRALRSDSPRTFGTLTSGEMLCHLGDCAASVLGRPGGERGRWRPLIKWVALSSPLPWPRGARTPANVDPRADGTRPGDFERDRERAVEGLRSLATAESAALPSAHFLFGSMSRRDWQRWAYRHTHHHLRQFGV